jgi:phage-related protein
MLQAVYGGLIAAILCMIVAAFGLIPAVVGALIQEIIDVLCILWALTAIIDRKIRR